MTEVTVESRVVDETAYWRDLEGCAAYYASFGKREGTIVDKLLRLGSLNPHARHVTVEEARVLAQNALWAKRRQQSDADPAYNPPTEAFAAARFASVHGADVRYNHRRGCWLLWREHRWAPDIDGAMTRLVLDFACTWRLEAMDLQDRDQRDRQYRAAIRMEQRTARLSMLATAADLSPITDVEPWDADPWLLGVTNGVVDLRTGDLRPGRRDDRITLTTGLAYDPAAQSERWTTAVRAILQTDDLIAFVQTAVGYSATGDTRRDCWFLGAGKGRNGKGTLYQPIRRALGDYAAELPASVLDARRESAPYDLAVLPGKRFVISSEAGNTIRLNHDRIKQISGGDSLRCANKYERSFEFTPVCKLWLAANRKPRVVDDSPAFWARVMLIPFDASFVGREDRDLRPSLEHDPAHQAAILAWVVQGAVRYHRDGLHPPLTVRRATSAYEIESDPLADFLADAMVIGPNSSVSPTELFVAYTAWAEKVSLPKHERLSNVGLGRLIGSRFDSTTGRKRYIGLGRRQPS